MPGEDSGYVPGDFQDEKAQIFIPGLVSVLGRRTKSTPPSLSTSPRWQNASRWSPTSPICQLPPRTASSCSSQWKKKVGAGQASRCLRAAVRQAGKGSSNHCQRSVSPCHLAMDKRRQKVRHHQQWSGLKLIRTNQYKKCFVLKLFRLAYFILITSCMSSFLRKNCLQTRKIWF